MAALPRWRVISDYRLGILGNSDVHEHRNGGVFMTVIPITQAQIDASEDLYGRLIIWLATDKVLRRLAEERPGAAFEDVMVKAEAINNYYGTRVARARMPVIAR